MSRAKKTCVLIVLVLTASLFLPLPAWAEKDPTSYVICGQVRDSAYEWSWENIEKRYSAELARGGYQQIYYDIKQAVLASPKQQDRDIQKRFVNKVTDVINGKANGRVLFNINVEAPPDLHVQKKYYLFKGDPDQIDLQDCGQNNERAEQLNELRYFAHAIVNLSDRNINWARVAAVNRIRNLEESYDRYLFEGFPMFPWEAAVNSVFLTKKNIADGPPRNQMVFLHLGTGFEINTESMKKSEMGVVASVEPIGWIYYPVSKEYRSWWGIAALTTFRHDMGMGVGIAVHYNAFSLGATWHEKDVPGTHYGQPYIFLGIDLYRYLDAKNRQYEQYVGKYTTLKDQAVSEIK